MMLVLARKLGEEIYIGKDIVIKVVKLGEGRVSLGISAPIEMSITRSLRGGNR